MKADRTITDLLSENRPLLSVEFFPPKNEEGGQQLLAYREVFKALAQGHGVAA